MSEATDKKATRIQVSAEQERLNRAAEVEQMARQAEIELQQQRAKLTLQRDKELAKQTRKQTRIDARQAAREKVAGNLHKLMPTIGRRTLICGPILAPMTVAWIGQISFATDTLKWPFIGALVFAAAWELTTAFSGWMFHQAQQDGDRGTLFRVATWVFATSAGAMNYWHACPVITERLNVQTVRHYTSLDPTPKAVSYGAMSLVGIALWELYSSLIHRKELREKGVVPAARPRFGILRWVRFPRITWTAWSLSVRYGIRTVDKAWAAAVADVERKRRDKDRRPVVRVTVARVRTHTVPVSKERLKLFWVEDLSALTLDLSRSGTSSSNRSETGLGNGSTEGSGYRSETDNSSRSETYNRTRSENGSGNRVPNDNGTGSGDGSETRKGDGSETGSRRRSRRRSRSGTKNKVPVSDRLAEARSVDKAYLAEHGRHIPAEKLAKALSIGKPAALDLVKQVRGGHIDIAK